MVTMYLAYNPLIYFLFILRNPKKENYVYNSYCSITYHAVYLEFRPYPA